MSKLPYDYVKAVFESRGCTLLSKEYIGAHYKLEYRCPSGHIHKVKWAHFSTTSGTRCPYCAGVAKLNINFIRKEFEKEDYILISKDYKNANTKLSYICPNGHTHSITWGSWSMGNRCPYCVGNGVLTIEYISDFFKKHGYTLLTKEYKNAFTPLESICPAGHLYKTTWNNFKSGKRCIECYNLSRYGEGNPSWQGGKSFEPYCEVWKDQEYKQDIRERDGNRCLNPYCSSNNSNDLTIHHIDYNKQNCKPSNLITVCRSCNSKANKDRRWHKAWY